MAEAVTSAANTAAAAVNSTTAAVSDAATAAATSVNQAAAAMPLSAQQAADDIAAAAHAVPSATAEEKEGFFKSLTKVFTGDDSKPPPRAVDIEKELAAKIEELPKNYVLIKARAENLDKMDKIKGSSDPFLRISKFDPETKLPTLVTETTRGIIQTELNPDFEELIFPKNELNIDAKGDAGIILEVYDFNVSGKYPRIGGCGGSLNSILSGAHREFDLIEPEKKKKDAKYKNSGRLIITEAKLVPRPQDVHDFKKELEDLKEEYDDWLKDQAKKAEKAAKEAGEEAEKVANEVIDAVAAAPKP